MKRVFHRWLPLLAVGGLLVATWFAAALSSPQLNNVPIPPLRGAASRPPATAAPSPTTAAPTKVPSPDEVTEVESPDERTGLIAAVGLMVMLAVGGTTGWVLYRRRLAASLGDPVALARRIAPPSKKRPGQDVVEVVDASLAELSATDLDPRKTVIACWIGLERAAAVAGTPRHPGDSPADLVTRLLRDRQVSPGALAGLAEVYREARYATHTIDEDMRVAAVAALGEVRSELAPAGVA